MATATHPLIRHIRHLAGTRSATELPDAHLLKRFATCGDESAFETLVRRHGPLVLGVCRRVLGDWHAAEDCFQTAFALLAQKAGALRQPERLGPWLFGVAYRTALKARARIARREVCERYAARTATIEPADDLVWRDLRPILDNAVASLPEKYRAAFVLHYLQGVSVDEVARRLDAPRGTVATRLARAREQLRKGLARRGLALSGGALVAALSGSAVAATVPPRVKALAVQAAAGIIAESIRPTGIAAGVAALGKGGLGPMFTIKKGLGALLLIAVLGAGGSSWLTLGAHAQKPEGIAAQPAAAEGKQSAPANQPRNDDVEEMIYRALREKGLWQSGGGYTIFARRVQARRLLDVAIVGGGPGSTPLAAWGRQGLLQLDRKNNQLLFALRDAQFTDGRGSGHTDLRVVPIPLPITPSNPQPKAQHQDQLSSIAIAQAQKDLQVADFYLRVGRPGSARFFYELASRRCPGTPLARQAQAGLEAVRGQTAQDALYGSQKNSNQNTPVLPPLESGKQHTCGGPPDRATILQALPRLPRSVPGIYEESRDNLEINMEKLVDSLEPARFFPLIGPAQMHHCHYKCVVSFDETIRASWPFAFECRRRRSEVVYTDRDHLHLVRKTDDGARRP